MAAMGERLPVDGILAIDTPDVSWRAEHDEMIVRELGSATGSRCLPRLASYVPRSNMKAILAIATSLQVLSCFGCHDCRTDPEATSRHVSPEKPAGPTGPDDSGRSRKVSVVYCTDLFHPHNDPDDHFDIATLYSIPEIDIRAIILDQNNRCGWDQEKTPGSVPVSQLNYITRRDVPFAAGR